MSHPEPQSTGAHGVAPSGPKVGLTVWPVALAIGGLSGSAAALLVLLDQRLVDWSGWALLLVMLSVPVLAIGYLALTLPHRWLRRTAMTAFVGGLLARLVYEIADGFAKGWSGRGEIAMCNESGLDELIFLLAGALILAAVLRRLARKPPERDQALRFRA